jgi:predicted ATPase
VPISRTLHARLQPLVTLLVLDNLEQLLPRSAGDVAELLRAAPGLRIIVTSREVLRVGGEHEYQVPPLDPAGGVELFLDRARLVRSDAVSTDADLAAVRSIVARLEGLPLAIELAAARIRMFGPTAILERLETSLDILAGGTRDLPERQRTLRGAISWSHELLSGDEQAIFRRLAVFSGGWDAQFARDVVDPTDTLGLPVVEGLEALADKSLVKVEQTDHGEPRFERHTLLREFALERLDHSGERPDCERRHALAFLALAESAGPHLTGTDSPRWLDQLEHEQHNMRAAMRWSLTVDEPEVGLRIVAASWRYWQLTSQHAEGAAWAKELLAHPLAGRDPRVRIGGLTAAGGLGYWANDFAAARAAYDERLRLAEELGDETAIAEAHYDIGFIGMVDQDIEFLRRHETIALESFERLGAADGIVRARQALVLGHFLDREYAQARELEVLNLAEFKRTGSRYRIADSFALLSVASILSGDVQAGRDYLDQSGRLVSAVLSDQIAGLVVTSLFALRSGRAEVGAQLAGAARAITDETGVTNATLRILHVPDPVELARESAGADADRWIAEGRSMALQDALALARRIIAGEDDVSSG